VCIDRISGLWASPAKLFSRPNESNVGHRITQKRERHPRFSFSEEGNRHADIDHRDHPNEPPAQTGLPRKYATPLITSQISGCSSWPFLKDNTAKPLAHGTALPSVYAKDSSVISARVPVSTP
jgi:hypothetical protein